MIHLNITITGKVQRVGFRFTAMQRASELGVVGFVMSMADRNKIYIEAEGDEEKVEEFKKWCRMGSPPARIEQISFESGAIKNFKSFEILDRK